MNSSCGDQCSYYISWQSIQQFGPANIAIPQIILWGSQRFLSIHNTLANATSALELYSYWESSTARHPPIVSAVAFTTLSFFLSSFQTDNSHHTSEPHRQRVSLITIRLGRQSHRDGGSVSESCQEQRRAGLQTPRRGENKWKTRKGGNGLSTPIYEQCTERSMFGLLMTCTDWEGVGRCSSNTTGFIS